MSLVVFRSKAAGEIFMFAETARRILEIIGRSDAPRGVITAEQVPDALAHLVAAVDQEKALAKEAAAAAGQASQAAPEMDRSISGAEISTAPSGMASMAAPIRNSRRNFVSSGV